MKPAATDWTKELEHAQEFLRKAWDAGAVATATKLLRWNLEAAPFAVRLQLEDLVRARMAELRGQEVR